METRAPGRVNLIGEHTDYNGGFVMPCAIAYETRVRARARADGLVHARSFFGQVAFDLTNLPAKRAGNWSDYVRGVVFELRNAGVALRSCELHITGNVPIGAGLSSSASFEVAVALALLATAEAAMESKDLALLTQRAENDYTGTRCGIMDQVAVLYGRAHHAVFLDTRTLETQLLNVPTGVAVVICDTMVKRELSKGSYNERRRECEQAAARLSERFPSVAQLADVTLEQLTTSRDILADNLYRRALHVVTENDRVRQAAAALQAGDIRQFGALMNASHQSLRELYDVSIPELDTMVQIAQAFPGVYGARMTGGGFGGCTVNLVEAERANDFREHVSQTYQRKTGIVPNLYDGTPSDGAQILA